MQLDLFENNKLILSVFDYTGNWPAPYIQSGYATMLWDIKHEGCLVKNFGRLLEEIEIAIEHGYLPYGLIAAPPCTDFAGSGAQWWNEKDRSHVDDNWFSDEFGTPWRVTELSVFLVELVLELQARYQWKFWVLENPVGRIEKLVPALKPFRSHAFNPCDYGDPYTKKTILWGEFNAALPKNPVEPEFIIWAGKKFPKIWAGTGGKSEKTKAKRSATPKGFANAFFLANQ